MQGAPPLGQALFRHLDECEACQRPHWSCPEYWAIIREFSPDPACREILMVSGVRILIGHCVLISASRSRTTTACIRNRTAGAASAGRKVGALSDLKMGIGWQ